MPGIYPHRWLAVFCLLFSLNSYSQGKLTDVTDSAGLRAHPVLNSDTVVVKYDTAYIMNKGTFKMYFNAYSRLRKGDETTKKLINDYEYLINLQDSMLRMKESYYQQLKSNFDSVIHGSNVLVNKTNTNIALINQSLTNATGELTRIQGLLDDSLKKLRAESRQKFVAAVKGFAVGVGVASLVFLITK